MHTWVDDRCSFCGSKDELDVLQQLLVKSREPGVSVVGGRSDHCPLNILVDVDWSCRGE